MKNIKLIIGMILITGVLFNCEPNEENYTNQEELKTDLDKDDAFFSSTWLQEDQMGRPAINTVFVGGPSKDMFNTTIPSEQDALFQAMFQTNLEGLSPAFANATDTNALGQNSEAFTSLLATDVLNVSLDGETTFFNPVSGALLTGRNLTDDVITVELLLIFGGEDFTENPGLSNDNVDTNDMSFSASFPYLGSPW